MSKRNEDNTLGIVFFVTLLAIVIGILAAYWLIITVILIISFLLVCLINIYRKKNNKVLVRNWVDTAFSDSIFIPTEKITIKEIKDELGIFDISIYDELFEPQIRQRGQDYYANKKVINIRNWNNLWEADVQGTKDYHVSIKFDDSNNDIIIDSNCECPYHKEDKRNCKHIYALLLKIKVENNAPEIYTELKDYSKRMKKLGDREVDYINNNQNSMHISEELLNRIKKYFSNLQNKLNYTNNAINQYKSNESKLLYMFKDLIEYSYLCNIEYEQLLKECFKIENPSKKYYSNNDRIKISDVVTGTLIVNGIDKKRKSKIDIDEDLEDEMDAYDLEEWQKDLVRKGEYHPWNFEEKNLEEGDYFYEDDDINDE